MNNKPITTILPKLHRGLVHLYNGTLLDRLQRERRQYVTRKRMEWWESQTSKREHFETTIQHGVQMRLYFDSQLSKSIFCGRFEWQEREFLNAFLRPEDIFVDVGANIGLFTLIAARCVGNAGHVYAFEPSPETYRRLVENVQLNQFANISVYQLALSNRPDQLEMMISKDGFDAWNSLAKPIAGNTFVTENVNCVTWNDFALENDLVGRVTMIKIDVEGWEKYVLEGGAKTLSRADAPILQVEFTEPAALSAGSSCEELYHLLQDFGYQMFVYDMKAKKLIPDPLRDSYPYLNLIATKQPEMVVDRLRNHSNRNWFRQTQAL